MSRFEFKLPDIGEGVTEGEVVSWLVRVGDALRENQDMVEVMTDKATVTIGSPRAGRVVELRAAEGDVVPVGTVLVVFELGAEETSAQGHPAATAGSAGAGAALAGAGAAAAGTGGGATVASAVGDLKESLPGMTAAFGGGGEAVKAPAHFQEQPLAAPIVRKLARELGVDLRRIPPTGLAGRVTQEDVQAFAAGRPASADRGTIDRGTIDRGTGSQATSGAASVPAPQTSPGSLILRPARSPSELTNTEPTAAGAVASGVPFRAPLGLAPARVPVFGSGAPTLASDAVEERVPIRGMRRRIFENMARSKRTAAHFTYVDECDVSALEAMREAARPHAEREGIKLSFLPFIIKAVVAALRRHPTLNCVVDDATSEMVLRKTYDIGIAVATDAGLTVPVLRGVEHLDILEIARELERLGSDARQGKTRLEDLGGSSFTITSLGKLGGLMATPIVNYPEVAILGVHAIKRRPIVRDEQIVVGSVMHLSLSFDHRVIDGHIGAAFAQEVIGYLQEPGALVMRLR